MTRATEPQHAPSATSPPSDRPPLGRFFMLFCAMLALALGLAALSDAGAATSATPPSADEPHAETAPDAPRR